MPSHSHVLHAYSPEEFCDALRELRERQGITLDAIADITKIPAYMFEGLEHNDLRRWPKGLFRRSFFRDYAKVIGLPISDACSEFVRWFPDEDKVEAPGTPEVAEPPPAKPLSWLWALITAWGRVMEASGTRIRLRIKLPGR
jgi:cytoskeletal protein RodZ